MVLRERGTHQRGPEAAEAELFLVAQEDLEELAHVEVRKRDKYCILMHVCGI